MEDTVAVNGVVDVNGVKDVNVATDRIYYELDGEGDADSSTTPGHNVDQRGQNTASWHSVLDGSTLHVPCTLVPNVRVYCVSRTDSVMSTKCQLHATVSVFDTCEQLTWSPTSQI
uniref:Uncharacterized protein n=1 Tax=Vespula pensylvanica TaxID=30213 RepID=A0A834K446_VESPE|nr:hypothetical protein H0235_016468 [Vespula pensylvanica]